MKLILDTTEKKDLIGESLANLLEESEGLFYIVSPYITRISSHSIVKQFRNFDDIRIICNAEGGDCDPYFLQSLMKHPNIKIKSRPDIHAKLYISQNRILLGSANFTENGMGPNQLEGAVLIEKNENCQKAINWFNKLWVNTKKDAQNLDWNLIKMKWNLKQKMTKQNSTEKQHLLDFIIDENIDDLVFQFYYDETVTDHKKVLKYYKSQKGRNFTESIDYYESEVIPASDKHIVNTMINESRKLNKQYRDHYIVSIECESKNSVKIDKFNFKEVEVSKLANFCDTFLIDNDRLVIINFHDIYNSDRVKRLPFSITNKRKQISKLCNWLNSSLNSNRKAWEKYLKSEDGKYWFCDGVTLKNVLLKDVNL